MKALEERLNAEHTSLAGVREGGTLQAVLVALVTTQHIASKVSSLVLCLHLALTNQISQPLIAITIATFCWFFPLIIEIHCTYYL